jgi:hypothetical protein
MTTPSNNRCTLTPFQVGHLYQLTEIAESRGQTYPGKWGQTGHCQHKDEIFIFTHLTPRDDGGADHGTEITKQAATWILKWHPRGGVSPTSAFISDLLSGEKTTHLFIHTRGGWIYYGTVAWHSIENTSPLTIHLKLLAATLRPVPMPNPQP